MKLLSLLSLMVVLACSETPAEPSMVERYEVPMFLVRLDTETTDAWVAAEFPDYQCDRYADNVRSETALWRCEQAYGSIVVQIVTP